MQDVSHLLDYGVYEYEGYVLPSVSNERHGNVAAFSFSYGLGLNAVLFHLMTGQFLRPDGTQTRFTTPKKIDWYTTFEYYEKESNKLGNWDYFKLYGQP